MKNIGLVLFAVVLLGLTETPVSAAVRTVATETTIKTKEETIFKRKRKGYRKKKGFMWGLFKKNDCGCPKH
ncbi:MAG: hypothetical protein LH609_07575 [Rudanella sp.]|nr:hypothetical protein [Rudanella sp.]